MYLPLLLILSVSYSQVTEINESQTYADYFCIFLRRYLQKSWSQVQLPWPASGLLRNRIGKQISVPKSRGVFLFVCLFSFTILNLTSDALPFSMSPDVLMHVSYQFTYGKDIPYFGISSFQNKKKMNLLYTSATASKTFTALRHISVLHMNRKETVCLQQMWTRKTLSLPQMRKAGISF